ncbi:hypothetical protein ABT282_31045 [Streptomyces sp. NPDC000927]|uniref:hypothetical protein n=1 Tax=Streptomyces sp. NPDC000927 TaxID=3154371 RepID=UPI003331CE43
MEQIEPDPWARMKGESERDFARFHQWLTFADRRLSQSEGPLGLKHARLEELSAKWKWQDRAAAWDLHHAKKLQEETVRLRSEAAHILVQGILNAARARLAAPDEECETADLQKLANSLKALTPSLDISVSKPVATGVEAGVAEDEITIAIRRARELQAGDG